MARYIFVFVILAAMLLLDAGACKLKPYVKDYERIADALEKLAKRSDKQ